MWDLLGNLARYPEYSSGLEKVEANVDSSGACTEYVCHFKPQEEDGESVVHREIIRWYEPNRGYASSADQALADIAENLVRRFGGRVVERYVEN